MVDGQLVETLGWYILGVFSYKIGSSLFLTSQALATFSEAVYYSLTVLKISHENILSAQEIKIQAMERAGVEQKIIDAANTLDSEFLETCRIASIYVLQRNLPSHYRHMASFKNWFQAMDYLDKRLRKNAQ